MDKYKIKRRSRKVCELASDYMLGYEIPEFADQYGGIDTLRAELFAAVKKWELAINGLDE